MTLALNLGGTIALTYVDNRPVSLSGSQVLGPLQVNIREIDPVQSYALEWSHLVRMRDEINSAYTDGERQFLVLTGTDTAEDLTYFLELVRPSAACVIVLVSMRTASASKPHPDGLDRALAWLAAGSPGVALCWGNDVIEGPLVEKVWGDESWCFRPIGWEDSLEPWQVDPETALRTSMPRVPILSAGIGSGVWLSDQLQADGFDGVVIEAFASGDVPPEAARVIGDLVPAGYPIVLTSRSRPGRIKAGFPGLEGTSHELLKQGAIGAGQLDAHRARLRLILALACDSSDEVKKAFVSYFA